MPNMNAVHMELPWNTVYMNWIQLKCEFIGGGGDSLNLYKWKLLASDKYYSVQEMVYMERVINQKDSRFFYFCMTESIHGCSVIRGII